MTTYINLTKEDIKCKTLGYNLSIHVSNNLTITLDKEAALELSQDIQNYVNDLNAQIAAKEISDASV